MDLSTRYIDAPEIEITNGPPYFVLTCSHCRRQITNGATACSYHPFAGVAPYDVTRMRPSRPAGKESR